ncbi:CRAL-TRIO domain-containing protein [Lentinula aciculospora]|uniref:CRAL-TRIO domain-containing protein n=1 Tax=Lentinula aciculospora TaxID=153920 RepID=A0A9W9DJA4_9AGAR|nr:CRAL-TRIO domain-containing protein [Lentinula aciculospora]
MSSSDAPMQASASALPEGITDSNYKPLPGRLGNLTVPQQHALEKFKKELQDEGVFVKERMDDATLLRLILPMRRTFFPSLICFICLHRFLRARKFDVALAKKMLVECEQWRKDFGVEDIVKNFDFHEKEQVDKYYPQFYHKMDKDGRPIYIEQLGKLDFQALYACTTQDRLLKRLVYEYEKFITSRLPACSAAVGHPVETSCTILDLKNVSLTNFYRVKDYVMAASSIGQDRYPECMGKFYIINAPWLFSGVWTVIRPWLDEVTVSKIDIVGSSYKDKLLAQIPRENLLKELGGTCQCEKGCSLSDEGPWNEAKWQKLEAEMSNGMVNGNAA